MVMFFFLVNNKHPKHRKTNRLAIVKATSWKLYGDEPNRCTYLNLLAKHASKHRL